MKRYTEPNENAYAIEVPNNWTIRGGINRKSMTQPHSVMTIESPQGQTFMLLGNPNAASYSTPTPMGMSMGLRPGMLYAPNGDPMIIQPYRTGTQYAAYLGQMLLQKANCTNIVMTKTRDKPPIQQNSAGVPISTTAGEAFFTCSRNGVNYEAYQFSLTQMFGQPIANVGAVWNADSSYFLVTPSNQLSEAGILLTKILGSVQMNPQWVAQQIRLAGASVQAAAHRLDEALAQQSQMMRQSMQQNASPSGATRGSSLDTASSQDEMDRLISGFDSYKDNSGNLYTVPYASEATGWYTNGLGAVAGTRTGQGPAAGWSQMSRVPTGP